MIGLTSTNEFLEPVVTTIATRQALATKVERAGAGEFFTEVAASTEVEETMVATRREAVFTVAVVAERTLIFAARTTRRLEELGLNGVEGVATTAAEIVTTSTPFVALRGGMPEGETVVLTHAMT